MTDNFFVAIEKIIVAHKFTIKSNDVCDYTSGRKFCGFIYGIDGEADYSTSDGKTLKIKSGDVVFVSEYTAYNVKTNNHFIHYTVNFYASPEKSFGERVEQILFDKDVIVLRERENAYFKHLFERLCTCWERKNPGYSMKAMCLLYELFTQFLLKKYYDKSGDLNYIRILPAKDYIDQNFSKSVNIDFLANLCNMSRTNFRRVFLESVGTAPISYRANVCILRAKDFLSCEIYNVSEVAQMCGFDDTNYFCRFFKKHTGRAPGEYKRLV